MTGFQTIAVFVLIGVLTVVIIVISIVLIVGLFLDHNAIYTNATMTDFMPTAQMIDETDLPEQIDDGL